MHKHNRDNEVVVSQVESLEDPNMVNNIKLNQGDIRWVEWLRVKEKGEGSRV